MFFIREAFVILVKSFFTFSDGHIKVIGAGTFYIKEVGSLSCLYFFRENLFPAIAVVLILFHSSEVFLVRFGVNVLSKVVFYRLKAN